MKRYHFLTLLLLFPLLSFHLPAKEHLILLKDATLLEQNGTMNDVVRNIVLSTVNVVGGGLDFKLADPVMRDPDYPKFPLRPGPRIMI